jgi:hypothetical protein
LTFGAASGRARCHFYNQRGPAEQWINGARMCAIEKKIFPSVNHLTRLDRFRNDA